MHPLLRASLSLATVATLCSALPAHALYKVVGPDGKVTYTDRPPTDASNKVQSVGAGGGGSGDVSSLPYELRQVVQRYPVTLYSTANCTPCDAARQTLRERGVPFSEKTVSNNEDNEALQRVTNGNDLPVMTVGTQLVRGWQRSEWMSYLDAAGYPKESKLPAGFSTGKAEPLTERKEAPVARKQAPAPAAAPAPAEPQPTTTIKF